MFDFLMTEEQMELQEEVRDFTRSIDRQYLLDMDAERYSTRKRYWWRPPTRPAGPALPAGVRRPGPRMGRGVYRHRGDGHPGHPAGLPLLAGLDRGRVHERVRHRRAEAEVPQAHLRGQAVLLRGPTEPRGGSDFFGATTTAKREGDDYVLHGQKRFIVGAEGADYFMAYARTAPEAPPRDSISCFLVDRDDDVEVKHVYGLMGARGGGTGRVLFRDTQVPPENLVGGENEGGQIFYRMMIPERLTSAAGALGGARAALEIAMRYTDQAQGVRRADQELPGGVFKVAESITELDAAGHWSSRPRAPSTAARCLRAGCAEWSPSRRSSPPRRPGTSSITACRRWAASPTPTSTRSSALLRDARLIMIWTGTNEIMNLIIQHELYKEMADGKAAGRDTEFDALEAFNEEEKIYE